LDSFIKALGHHVAAKGKKLVVVTLAGDAHTTIDNEVVNAAQIIAHHNQALNGFSSGECVVTVKPASEIDL